LKGENMKNPFLVIAIIFLLAFIWLGRYQVTPGSHGFGFHGIYKLDRWTGKVIFIPDTVIEFVTE